MNRLRFGHWGDDHVLWGEIWFFDFLDRNELWNEGHMHLGIRDGDFHRFGEL